MRARLSGIGQRETNFPHSLQLTSKWLSRHGCDPVRMVAMRLCRIIVCLVCVGLCSTATLLAQSMARRLDSSAPISYYVSAGDTATGFVGGDRQLAAWALEQWQKASGGTLRFMPSGESDATLRVYWADARAGPYGEMRPLIVNGRPGAAVFIHPDLRALGPDIAPAQPAIRSGATRLSS